MNLVGKKAPKISSGAVINGEEIVENFNLDQYLGKKNVILFFYPKDFTFVCPTEIHAFQEKLAEFEKRDTVVIGCSTDTEETHLAWLTSPFLKIAKVGKLFTVASLRLAGNFSASAITKVILSFSVESLLNFGFINRQFPHHPAEYCTITSL